MNPWPGTFFEYAGKTIKLLEAEYNEIEHPYKPGLIINERFEIACGKGVLLPKKLQLPGCGRVCGFTRKA
jgi:methionyl-tRNA formyltransferase